MQLTVTVCAACTWSSWSYIGVCFACEDELKRRTYWNPALVQRLLQLHPPLTREAPVYRWTARSAIQGR